MWLCGAAAARATGAGGETGELSAALVDTAHTRAEGGASMNWQWPAPASLYGLENAHERAVEGGAMNWQWPTP